MTLREREDRGCKKIPLDLELTPGCILYFKRKSDTIFDF